MELEGKNVLVLGLGASGLSMARWLSRRGARVRVADTRSAPPFLEQLQREMSGVHVDTGAFRQQSFDGISLLAMSPGVSLSEPLVRAARARGIPVAGDIEMFAWERAGMPHSRVIGITGSNGKSTVTEMTGAVCRECAIETVVAGNIGLPVLDALMQIDDRAARAQPRVFVLELSSFQLETTFSLSAEVATILNISEDHLDRYADMAAYAAAKARVYQGRGKRLVNRDDPRSVALAPAGPRLSFGGDAPAAPNDWGLSEDKNGHWLMRGREKLLRTAELQVSGLHNAANALAALALGSALDLPVDPGLRALRNFKGLAHRVEKVAQIADVTYFDDSKGTNVGATVAALEGLAQKVVLIAGGDGKGQDFAPLAQAVRRNARAVVLIGRDAQRIEKSLSASGVQLRHAASLPEAVRLSAALAGPGDAVLLSPACASFDMFRNYEHRAQVFVDAVRALQH